MFRNNIDVIKAIKRSEKFSIDNLTVLSEPEVFLKQLGNIPNNETIKVEAIIANAHENYFFRTEHDFWEKRDTTSYINGTVYGAIATLSAQEAYYIAKKYIQKSKGATTEGLAFFKELRKNNQHKFIGEIKTLGLVHPSWRFQAKYYVRK